MSGLGETIIAEARSWIGTPYQHQASCKGYGTDCLGLLRGIWRACIGDEPAAVPAYTPDWSEPSGPELLLGAARRYLEAVPGRSAQDGDVAVFRMPGARVAKHVGFLAGCGGTCPTVIHAYSGRGVVETPMTAGWRGHVAGLFRFPGA